MVEIDLNTVRHGRPIDQWFAIDMPPVSATDERPLSPKAERRRSSGLLLGGGHPGDSSTLSLPGLSSSANRGNGALRVKLILTVSRMPSRHGKQSGAVFLTLCDGFLRWLRSWVSQIEKIMPYHEYHDLLEAFVDPELACAEGAPRTWPTPQPHPLSGTMPADGLRYSQ